METTNGAKRQCKDWGKGKKKPIRLFSPLLSQAWSKGISVSERMKSHLQSPEKTRLLLSV